MSTAEPPDDLFRRAVHVMREMQERHLLYVSLSPPFRVNFLYVPSFTPAKRAELVQKAGLSEDDFKEASDEIPWMMLAILQNTESSYIEARVEQEVEQRADDSADEDDAPVSSIDADEFKAEQSRRFALVREALVDQHMRDRYLLKATSKAPIFTDLDWDTKLKATDRSLDGGRCNLPYATVKLLYQREFGAGSYAPYAVLMSRAFDSVTVNFSVDDLEYMIECLGSVRNDLIELDKVKVEREMP